MNENLHTSTATHLPPILPPQSPGAGRPRGGLARLYTALRGLPARDTDRAIVGGVCATLAARLGVSPAAVRAGAVLTSLVLGVGVGLYLIAWTVLPDRAGHTHLELALTEGRGRSLLVLAAGALAALGAASGGLSFLVTALPALIAVAAVGLVSWWLVFRVLDRSSTTS